MKSCILPFIALLLALTGACNRNPRYYFDKATKLAAEGKTDDAVLTYLKAIQGDTSFGEAYFQLGTLLWRAHRVPDAYAALSRAVELLPRRDDIKVKLADLELTSYLADERHPGALYSKVAILADQLLANNPESWDGLRLKGHLAASGKDYKKAEDYYGHADREKPLQPEVVLGWTKVLLDDGQAREAEQLALRLIAKEKSYGPIYDLLYKYYVGAKRLPDAENILKTRVDNNPADSGALLELASFYAAASREDEMQATLRRLVADPKKFPDCWLQSGDLYSGLKRWNDALRQYEQGATLDPKRKIDYLRKIADLWLAQGKSEQASRAVDEILKQSPHDPSARGLEASILISTGKPDDLAKAAAELKSLAEKDPKNVAWHFNLGRALAAKGDTDGARIQFQEAVNLQNDFLPARLALLELAQARHDYKASVYYADAILALHPNMQHVRLLRAVSLMYTGRDNEASAELADMERSSPNDPEVPVQIAAMKLHQKKYKEAEDDFRKLVGQHRDDPKAMNGLVETLGAENHPDNAISVLREALNNSPDSVPVRSILARTAALAGRYDLAIEQYRQLLALAPRSEAICLDLGTVYRMKGDFANAIGYLQQARALDSNDPVPMIRLAGVFALTGRRPEALAIYRDALRLKPGDAATWSNAAFLISETGGSLDEAVKFAQKAVELDAKQPEYRDTLGWVYLRKHLNDSAIQVFRVLTRNYPADATFHYHLGLALLEGGDKEPARAELKAALAGKPSDQVKRNVEAALAK